MNLVPAINAIEEQMRELHADFNKQMSELEDGLATLRKLNTVCERCGGAGKFLRSRACAEDDRPDPNDPRDYHKCDKCHGTGKVNKGE